jgi:hypothetical protein
MIVIATYNDTILLDNFLNSLKKTENLDEVILIVCTCPIQNEMIDFLNKIKNQNDYNLNIITDVTPYSGYDTGAYIWAFNNYNDEYYIFLQDSLIINDKNWLNKFKEFRNENTLNTWCSFSLNDETPHTNFFLPKMGFHPNSLNGHLGIFGPIFQISKHALEIIDKKFQLNNFIPHDKMSSCAMERGWSYLSIYSGININCIDGEHTRDIKLYENKLMTKIFNNRI